MMPARSLPTRPLPAWSVVALMLLMVAPAHAANTLECSSIPSLMKRYVDLHVGQGTLDSALKDRAVERYMRYIDPSKSLFTQAEAADLVRELRGFLDRVADGNCDGLDGTQAKVLAKHAEMEAFVAKLLADAKLEIDKTVELKVDADDREHPADVAARDALRRKLVHFQLANYVSAGTAIGAAKEKLVHRYELITRRVRELSKADVYSRFLDAFATALDPHSSYFSAEALEDFRIAMDLSLEGIGAVLRSEDGYTIVNEIVRGGAADRQGELKTKDKIIAC